MTVYGCVEDGYRGDGLSRVRGRLGGGLTNWGGGVESRVSVCEDDANVCSVAKDRTILRGMRRLGRTALATMEDIVGIVEHASRAAGRKSLICHVILLISQHTAHRTHFRLLIDSDEYDDDGKK